MAGKGLTGDGTGSSLLQNKTEPKPTITTKTTIYMAVCQDFHPKTNLLRWFVNTAQQ